METRESQYGENNAEWVDPNKEKAGKAHELSELLPMMSSNVLAKKKRSWIMSQ